MRKNKNTKQTVACFICFIWWCINWDCNSSVEVSRLISIPFDILLFAKPGKIFQGRKLLPNCASRLLMAIEQQVAHFCVRLLISVSTTTKNRRHFASEDRHHHHQQQSTNSWEETAKWFIISGSASGGGAGAGNWRTTVKTGQDSVVQQWTRFVCLCLWSAVCSTSVSRHCSAMCLSM